MAIRQVTRAGVGLVVGIIILGLLVFGGLWLVRERGEQARREEAINIADQQLQQESGQDVALETNNEATEAPAQSEATQGSGQPESPVTTTQPAAGPAATSELPQTGPETSLIGIGLLSFAAVSFARSRKQLLN
jgi:FtsZ-interacting cell division protein ZipA